MLLIRNRKKGIILMESLLGIFFLASIVLYAISSFVIGKYVTQLSRERLVVSNLLREDMESFISCNYSTIVDGLVSTYITVNDGARNFSATKIIDPETVGAGIYGYKKIYGRIEWLGGISRNQSLLEEMVVYVTRQ